MAPRRPLSAAPGLLQRLLLAASCLAAAVSAKSSLLDTSAVAHGMIIDAGSGGSRLHVFRWGSRQFDSAPPPISYPFSKNDWCNRLRPGISSYADHPQDVGQSLKPLVDFAKSILKDHEKDWHRYPIYLRATAGMRQLEPTKRVAVLDAIRDYLGGPECPFHFEYHYVRVLAGEEEGVYGWAAVNFLRGDLLPSSDGAGTAASASTVGALDMGGASTQISFFRPDQDIMSNLFKLQIGSQKHWNVYTHSFLGFGEAAMRMRLDQLLVDAANGLAPHERALLALRAVAAGAEPPATVRLTDDRFGDSVDVPVHPHDRLRRRLSIAASAAEQQSSEAHSAPLSMLLGTAAAAAAAAATAEVATAAADAATPARALRQQAAEDASEDGDEVEAEGADTVAVAPGVDIAALPAVESPCLFRGAPRFAFTAADGVEYAFVPAAGGVSFEACRASMLPLLNKRYNAWCDVAFNGQCSMSGIYQPAVPRNVTFYAFSGFRRAWNIMDLPSEQLTLAEYREGARGVCALTHDELVARNTRLGGPLPDNLLDHACYAATYAVTLLADGYGFTDDLNLVIVNKIDKYKIGWALGAMLYEINALPWEYVGPGYEHHNATAIAERKKHHDNKFEKLSKKRAKKTKQAALLQLPAPSEGSDDDEQQGAFTSMLLSKAWPAVLAVAAAVAGAVYGRRTARHPYAAIGSALA